MSQVISLKELYKFAKTDHSLIGMNGSSGTGKAYARMVKDLTKNISDEAGFYIWGNFNKRNYWISIYIGQTGINKTAGLRGRILKELNSERALIWQYYHDTALMEQKCKEFYSNKYATYIKQWERAYRRSGTTYVITIPTQLTDNRQIENVESDLIETMNPSANRKRPKPNTEEFLDESIRVLRSFKEEINKIRKTNKNIFRLTI